MNSVQVYNFPGTKFHYNMPVSCILSHIYNSNLPQIPKTYCSPQLTNTIILYPCICQYILMTSLKLHKNSKPFESTNYFLTTALSFNRFDYELH